MTKWDECLQKQQTELNRMGVPGIQVAGKEVRKQKKIVSVLVDMLDDEEGAKG